jgi:[CysO sulfur-carrier protein]-thiocarboxylate-dependent cysteine synthase
MTIVATSMAKSHMVYKDILSMVGKTPSIGLRVDNGPAQQFFMKLEGSNPSGSIKDRACVFMLQSALEDGTLVPGRIVLDASSGNFACALALYTKYLGYQCEVAVSSKLTSEKRGFLEYLGTRIYNVGDFTIEGNEFCRQLNESNPGKYFFTDQLHNWRNPQAHYQTTGPEIIFDFPDIAMVVGSLGSGGTMAGIGEYLKRVAPHVKVVVVESAAGNRIPGTGTFVDGDYVTPFIQRAYQQNYFDYKVLISESEAARAVQILIGQGIFCGLQTGGVLHAALDRAKAWNVKGPIVMLSGDTGWKNLDRLLTSRTL